MNTESQHEELQQREEAVSWSETVPPDRDLYDWYAQMRQERPVYYNERSRSWMVFRYADVQHVLLDPVTYSSNRVDATVDGAMDPVAASILGVDPPRHRQLRNLVTQAFTPRTIARLEPRIESITQDLLARVEAQGKMDMINDLAFPLPITVIAELLGVPLTDQEKFRQWSEVIVGTDIEKGLAAKQEMGTYFLSIVAQRQQQPQDDLISALLTAEVDGERLPEIEILGFCVLLLVAGHETTTNLLGNAILCFDEHPEAADELRANPTLLPNAIEEILRYYSPVHAFPRRVAVDTVLQGQKLKEGDFLLPMFASANRDEKQFPHADIFDIHRTPNRHLAFGHGIHFCLGAPLARLEARVVLQRMLERFTSIRVDRSAALERKVSGIIYGLQSLPITFEQMKQPELA